MTHTHKKPFMFISFWLNLELCWSLCGCSFPLNVSCHYHFLQQRWEREQPAVSRVADHSEHPGSSMWERHGSLLPGLTWLYLNKFVLQCRLNLRNVFDYLKDHGVKWSDTYKYLHNDKYFSRFFDSALCGMLVMLELNNLEKIFNCDLFNKRS